MHEKLKEMVEDADRYAGMAGELLDPDAANFPALSINLSQALSLGVIASLLVGLKEEHEERNATGPFWIIVNGTESEVELTLLTYEEIVTLAGKEGEFDLTVTYHRAAPPADHGTMVQGETVEVRDGTIFNAYYTGSA